MCQFILLNNNLKTQPVYYWTLGSFHFLRSALNPSNEFVGNLVEGRSISDFYFIVVLWQKSNYIRNSAILPPEYINKTNSNNNISYDMTYVDTTNTQHWIDFYFIQSNIEEDQIHISGSGDDEYIIVYGVGGSDLYERS